MRAQTTLEFIMLLSAAASLSVFAIGIYASMTNAQKPLYMKVLNQTGAASGNYAPTTGAGYGYSAYASMPDISYVNRSNSLELVLTSPAGSKISSAYASASGGASVIPDSYYNISSDGLVVLTFSVVPGSAGAINISAVADFTYLGNETARSAYAETYAVRQNASNTTYLNPVFSASLERRNESVMYILSNGASTYTASMWSHCSYLDWSYKQASLTAQCGNANWYFWEYDPYCISTITHCVKLYPANTTVSYIEDEQKYGYNTTLTLYNGTLRLSSSLSSVRNSSALGSSSGKVYGNASVIGVSGVGPQPYSSYVVLDTSGSERAANISYYNTYLQYLNNFYSLMDYYNNSNENASVVVQGISTLNSEARDFADTKPSYNQYCNVTAQDGTGYYSCMPVSGLYYTINVSANPAARISSQSISVQGSIINVR
jgi:hypothetical protein